MKQAIEVSTRKLLPLPQRSAWNTSSVYSPPGAVAVVEPRGRAEVDLGVAANMEIHGDMSP